MANEKSMQNDFENIYMHATSNVNGFGASQFLQYTLYNHLFIC